MNKKHKGNNVYEGLSPRQVRALLCLARGLTITEVSRRLHVSRGALYNWLSRPEFRSALHKAQIDAATNETVAENCLDYRIKVLEAVVKIFVPASDSSDVLLDRFNRRLDRIDKRLKLDEFPYLAGLELGDLEMLEKFIEKFKNI